MASNFASCKGVTTDSDIARFIRETNSPSASVTETDPDRLSLLPDCCLGSFHRLRDLYCWRPRFRVRLQLTQIFFAPWFPSQRLLVRHKAALPLDRLIKIIIARQDQTAQSVSSGMTFP
jgi:hypothetical protein